MRTNLSGLLVLILLAGCSESHADDDAPAELDTPELDTPGCGECTSLGMVCDPASDACVECLEDTDCTAPETCTSSHVCTSSCGCVSDADCDDGVFCNGTETCASDCAETCTAGTPVSCEAGERCDEALDRCAPLPACDLPNAWFRDADDDGYGDVNDVRRACEAPPGYVARFGDCDDLDELQSPGSGEACDGTIDEDCDGAIDEGCACTGFGTRPCGRTPGCAGVQQCAAGSWQPCSVLAPSPELCGGGDEDCDGVTDEASSAFYCADGASCEAGACTPSRVRSIAAGFNAAFAIFDDGRAMSWGSPGPTPALVMRAAPTRELRAGLDLSGAFGLGACAVLEGDRLACGGPRGVGVRTDARDVVAVDATLDVGCFVERGGGVRCWGGHVNGALGPGVTMPQYTAIPIAGVDDAVDVALPGGNVCVLRREGDVRCWGNDGQGLLGNGTMGPSLSPVTVSLVDDATRLVGGGSHACVQRPSGIWCWGRNDWGQLGDGTPMFSRSSPIPATVWPPGAMLPRTMAGASTCVRTATGTVLCIGAGTVGELGNGRMESSSVPVQVTGLADVVDLAGNNVLWCALTASGEVYCWGQMPEGTLGDGVTSASATPVRVVFP